MKKILNTYTDVYVGYFFVPKLSILSGHILMSDILKILNTYTDVYVGYFFIHPEDTISSL